MSPSGSGIVHVLGEVMVDTVARIAEPLARDSDTPAAIADVEGGSAANTAAWLATEGVPVDLIASVGADDLGDRALARLAEAGVHLSVSRHPTLPTGRCVVIVGADGERTMLPDPGANAVILPGDIDTEDWAIGDHLHVSGYSLMRSSAREAALAALAAARDLRLSVSLDASSAEPLRATGPERFLSTCLPGDILFANVDEAAVLSGSTDPGGAATALAARGLTAIVKAGAAGAFAATEGRQWHVPAVPVGQVLDTTGAGDAFAAGFLAAWRVQADVADALEGATRLAARALTRWGARP